MSFTGTFLVVGVVTVLLTVAVLGVSFYFLQKSGIFGGKKVLQHGIAGTATVVSIDPTGMVVNELYYQCRLGLRVQLPGEAPYDVFTNEMVAITSMALVAPGAVVQVKVDQQDRTQVGVDWAAGVTPPHLAAAAPATPTSAADIAAAARAGGLAGVPQGSSAELLRTGQRVRGVLTEFADTGNTPRSLGMQVSDERLADDPMYALTLQLHIPNLAPMDAKVVHRVPRAQVPNLHLGWELNCAVDPADPSRSVAVDWGDAP